MRMHFNKVLSVDYSTVNYRDTIVEQLSRMFLSFLTKQLYPLDITFLFLLFWVSGNELQHHI